MSLADIESDEIFIVDDDATLCDLLSLKLRDAGFRTTSFTNGQAFVEIMRRRTPACVILDVFMPPFRPSRRCADAEGTRACAARR